MSESNDKRAAKREYIREYMRTYRTKNPGTIMRARIHAAKRLLEKNGFTVLENAGTNQTKGGGY